MAKADNLFSRILRVGILIAILSFAVVGCDAPKQTTIPENSPEGRALNHGDTTEEGTAATVPAAPDAPIVLALGDSLTAGFGLEISQSYPAELERILRTKGYPHKVTNAGVSGDTSAGGLNRTDWLLRQRPDVLILALGSNDGLRGLGVEQMRNNLDAIIVKAKAAGAQVLLMSTIAPGNLGKDYTQAFNRVFPDLAKKHGLTPAPFLLKNVLGVANLNQGDGIHPNAEGARIVAQNVWNALEPMLIK